MKENNGSHKRISSINSWKDVRTEVHAVNKELANIIDEISPDNSYKLVKVEYLYGDIISRDGMAQLPTADGDLFPLNSQYVDKKIKQELSYRNLPLFLILEKNNEVFVESGNRAVPLNLFCAGSICGTYEFMDFMMGMSSNYNWSFSAGSRSIIMLPKITDKLGLKRLYAGYNIPSSFLIEDFSDHWELFRLISQSENFKQPWKNKVIYFGRKWFENKNNSASWRKFRNYVTKQAWEQVQYSLSKLKFSLQWGKYAEAIASRRLKPKPYIFDQLKHILSIARGDYPAFRPMDNTQESAPSEGMKDAIIDVYMLKDYLPTIMHAVSFKHLQPGQSVYYSLSLPTLLEGSPLKKSSSTTILDLREIKLLIETLRSYLERGEWKEDTIISQTKFNYFHIEKDKLGEIKQSNKIIEDDIRFLQGKSFNNRTFCSTSQFFRGCIRITPSFS